MKRNVLNSVRVAALAIPAVLALGTAAMAGPYPGTSTALTSGAQNTRGLFTISANGITVTGDTSITNPNKYYLFGNQQLIGFRSIYLVNPAGPVPFKVSTKPDGGYSEDSSMNKSKYNAVVLDGYTGYDDGASGKGFDDGSKWVVVADPTLAGKLASNKNTYGSFDFSSLTGGYDIGLDYILKGGDTGRAYFTVPYSPVPPAVPEPGSLASLALGSLGLGVLALRARKRSLSAA